MIYFDSAATSMPKPEAVLTAVTEAMNTMGNPSRGAHEASLAGLRCLGAAREELAEYLGVRDPSRVIFTSNATGALNIAIGGLGGHIVTTAAEHNSVLRPIYRKNNYTVVPLDEKGRLNLDDLAAAIRDDTGGVVMNFASNVVGNVYDVSGVADICRKKRIPLIVDGSQSVGLLPVHMEKMGISALCFSGHKALYGPQGIGCLCLMEDFTPPPLMVGGSGTHSFDHTHPTSMPDALEAGTHNAHGVAGLLAGLRYVRSQNGGCFTVADQLARRFIAGVEQLPGVTLYGDLEAPVRVPVVSLRCQGISCADVAFMLSDRYGIAVRAGAHCAPMMHCSLGTQDSGTVRFSFSHFNTKEEVDKGVAAVKKIVMKQPGYLLDSS